MITNSNAGDAIVGMLFLVGVSVYFFERVATISNYSDKTYQEIKLENIRTITLNEPFLLSDFYYRDIDFNRLDGQRSKAIALYINRNDSTARIGIEINKKQLFQKEVEEFGKILVEPDGGMWELPTYQGVKLFGYQYLSNEEIQSLKKQTAINKFDEGIDRKVMLRYIPSETLTGNWMEITGFSILIIGLLILVVVSFRKSIRNGEWGKHIPSK